MDAFLSRWLDSMVAVSWQFSLLFVVVLALTRLLRPWFTPAARHLLWSLLLLRLAFPFGLEAPFGVAPRPEVWLDRLAGTARSLLAGSTGEDSTQTTATQRDRDVQPRSGAAAPSAPGFIASGGRDHGIEHRQAGLSLASIACFSLWVCAVAAIGALHLRRAWRNRPVVLTSIDSLSAEARSALDRAAAALALRRLPGTALVDEPVDSIRIAGFLSPRLELPARMNLDWTAADLEPVFLHELAHLKRRDPWTRAASNLLHTLFFFHPLVWIAARQARVERELACDDLAVRQCTSGRRGYVEALLRLAGEADGSRLEEPFALAATGDRGGLRYRLSRLVAEDYRPTLRTSPVVATAVVLAIAVGAGGSIYGERPASPAAERHAKHSHADWHSAATRTPERVRDAHVALVGGEGREVIDVHGGSRVRLPRGDSSFYSRPPYLILRSKPEAPVDLAGVPEGVYSFGLSFDGDGQVSAVELDLFLPRTSAFIADETGDPPAALVDWIDGFELEIPAGSALESSTLGGFVDVEVRGGRATMLTRAPAGVDELRATIERHYRLKPDRSLDLLPPPYPDSRAALYRFGRPGQARLVPEGPTLFSIALDRDGHPHYLSAAFGCGDLRSVLTTIGYGDHLVEGDVELLDRPVDADLLVRAGTPPETLLAELEVALHDRIGLEVDLAHSRESRRTIILRGSLRELEPDPRSQDGLAIIEFWGDVATDGTGGGGGMGPAAPMLARVLARATGMPVTLKRR